MYLSRFVSKQFLEIRKCFCFCGKLITYGKGVCESGGEGVGGGDILQSILILSSILYSNIKFMSDRKYFQL